MKLAPSSRAAQPKQIWEVSGAAHVDLHRYAKEQYEQRVGEFIERWLSTPGT